MTSRLALLLLVLLPLAACKNDAPAPVDPAQPAAQANAPAAQQATEADAASKAAAISITQSAALALAPHVTVNAICPGVVDTPMWSQIDREWTAADQRRVGAAWQERIRGIPLGRPETPEDLTGMAVFLASAESDYITGQSYHVDGGLVMQ